MAAVGALLVSSGIALMATPPSALAGDSIHKSYVCKFVGKPGSGEVVQQGGNPIYVDNHAISGKDDVSVGDLFTDAQGFSVVVVANTDRLDPEPGAELCAFATATVTPIQPSCANDNTASYTKTGSRVASWSQSAEPAPGATITVIATAEPGAIFSSGLTTKSFTLVFGPEETNCTAPEVITPPRPTFVDPTCTSAPAVHLPDATAVDPDLVSYATSGALVAGGTVTVTATAVPPAQLAEGDWSWQHTFTVPTGCTIVEPPGGPTVEPPTHPTTPTVVEAGLAGDGATSDAPAWQGLVLVAGGLLLIGSAGGLALRTATTRRTTE